MIHVTEKGMSTRQSEGLGSRTSVESGTSLGSEGLGLGKAVL